MMKQRRALYVEDVTRAQEVLRKYFTGKGWRVDVAKDVPTALKKLRAHAAMYDVIILDLKLPVMKGQSLIETLHEEGIQVPPVIVLSAFLDEIREAECRSLGVLRSFDKPGPMLAVEDTASQVVGGTWKPTTNGEQSWGAIDYMVNRRVEALKRRVQQAARGGLSAWNYDEPIVVVGRRWNSWYPSVFPVPGGAYAVVCPRARTGTEYYEEEVAPTAIIDPGFRFLEVFQKLGISVASVESAIVTHNHPDHIGGVFEFMAARHACGKRTKAYCSRSVCNMLGNCSGFYMEIGELHDDYRDVIEPYPTATTMWVQIRAKGFATSHEEIGKQNTSRGVILTSRMGRDKSQMQDVGEVVILGDTEYNRADHRNVIVPKLCAQTVRMVVLHIGSSQLRQATGKHLYVIGLREILHDMDSELAVTRYPGKLLVAVSEWGLEHATAQQLSNACKFVLPEFNEISPIEATIQLLQGELERIVLLPADIGLAVGMKTGRIYLPGGLPTPAEDVDFCVTEQGISYCMKCTTPAA